MPLAIAAPVEMLESVANPRLPANSDRRLQRLMDRNTNGQLTGEEKGELAALAEWSEEISLLRAAPCVFWDESHDRRFRSESPPPTADPRGGKHIWAFRG